MKRKQEDDPEDKREKQEGKKLLESLQNDMRATTGSTDWEKVPSDVWVIILSSYPFMDIKGIASLCSTNKWFFDLCRNKEIWKKVLERQFPSADFDFINSQIVGRFPYNPIHILIAYRIYKLEFLRNRNKVVLVNKNGIVTIDLKRNKYQHYIVNIESSTKEVHEEFIKGNFFGPRGVLEQKIKDKTYRTISYLTLIKNEARTKVLQILIFAVSKFYSLIDDKDKQYIGCSMCNMDTRLIKECSDCSDKFCSVECGMEHLNINH